MDHYNPSQWSNFFGTLGDVASHGISTLHEGCQRLGLQTLAGKLTTGYSNAEGMWAGHGDHYNQGFPTYGGPGDPSSGYSTGHPCDLSDHEFMDGSSQQGPYTGYPQTIPPWHGYQAGSYEMQPWSQQGSLRHCSQSNQSTSYGHPSPIAMPIPSHQRKRHQGQYRQADIMNYADVSEGDGSENPPSLSARPAGSITERPPSTTSMSLPGPSDTVDRTDLPSTDDKSRAPARDALGKRHNRHPHDRRKKRDDEEPPIELQPQLETHQCEPGDECTSGSPEDQGDSSEGGSSGGNSGSSSSREGLEGGKSGGGVDPTGNGDVEPQLEPESGGSALEGGEGGIEHPGGSGGGGGGDAPGAGGAVETGSGVCGAVGKICCLFCHD